MTFHLHIFWEMIVSLTTEIILMAGGTFALYSLICRYANVNLLPNRQPADEHISSFKLKLPTPELERALNIKEVLERKSYLKTLVLLLVLMGTSMIIGDGILTPAISGILFFFFKFLVVLERCRINFAKILNKWPKAKLE